MADSYAGTPVDRRLLGVDRRSLAPALVVFALTVLLALVLPAVDRLVPGPADTIRPGDRLNLGGGVTIAPPVGWQLLEGLRVGEPTTAPVPPGAGDAALAADGVMVRIHQADFEGDAAALLDQVERIEAQTRPELMIKGARSAVTAQGGITGLVEQYSGPSTEGLVAAYTFDGTGMTVIADASADTLPAHMSELEAMLRSVARQEQA